MENQNTAKNRTTGIIFGFEYLRAFCSLFVVAIHALPIGKIAWTSWLAGLINITDYNVFYLSVPIFLQISLFLFYSSRSIKNNYFGTRLKQLLKLYAFWVLCITAFWMLIGRKVELPAIIQGNPFSWIKYGAAFLITGGVSHFFFLFSLIVLTIAAEAIWRIDSKFKIKIDRYIYGLLLASCLVVFLLPLIHFKLGNSFNFLTIYWNPINFLPYIFSSFLIYKRYHKSIVSKDEETNRLLFFLIGLSCLFAIFEWSYIYQFNIFNENNLPPYSRLSVVFGSWAVVLFSLHLPKSPKVLKLLSDYSLGIYCLHPFVIPFIGMLTGTWLVAEPVKNLFNYVLVILIVFFLTKYLRKIKLLKGLV